jgi:glyoxylase-like metal-dependent hydrolase (beta-lactamase superfamily II)
MKVGPGIYQLNVPIPDNPLEHLNCYLVEGKDGWLMVDTGWYTPETLGYLQTGLSDMGLTFSDISTIIITHVHADHFGLAGRIKKISPKTQLLTHQLEADLIESRYVKLTELMDKMSTLLERHGVPPMNIADLKSTSIPAPGLMILTYPDQVLYGGEIISTGVYDLEVIWTPGHSPGHICLYEPKNQLLFSGDHILPCITSNVGYYVQCGDNPLGDYLYSLHKLENLSVTRVLPAHENIFDDLRNRIKQIAVHHDRRKTEIQERIVNEPHNAWEISAHISWDIPMPWDLFPPMHKRSAVAEVVAHLECMRWEGRVRRIIEGNKVSYTAL